MWGYWLCVFQEVTSTIWGQIWSIVLWTSKMLRSACDQLKFQQGARPLMTFITKKQKFKINMIGTWEPVQWVENTQSHLRVAKRPAEAFWTSWRWARKDIPLFRSRVSKSFYIAFITLLKFRPIKERLYSSQKMELEKYLLICLSNFRQLSKVTPGFLTAGLK